MTSKGKLPFLHDTMHNSCIYGVGIPILCVVFLLLFFCMCVEVIIQVLETGCSSTWKNISPSIHLLTFTSCFVIDLLSILKVIIFSAIATDDHHPLQSCSIYQNAANCKTIRFRLRNRGGEGVATLYQLLLPIKKIMESSEDVFCCRNCSKAQPHVSRQRRSLEASTLSFG